MIICKHSRDIKEHLAKINSPQSSVGFVPTMGALHPGHLSLLSKSKSVCSVTVCSIFVNPTQFNNPEDFKKYPKTIENDLLLLEENGCDILFMPDEKEIYPNEEARKKHFELGYLETILEGKFRPGHFQGVCMVVEKLLDTVHPGYLFMGQKDYQQCMVITRLITIMNINTQLIVCPILREPSGLAMSSRNMRLSEADRKTAANINKELVEMANDLNGNNFAALQAKAISHLEQSGFTVEYLELAKSDTLELISEFKKKEKLVILIAVYLGGIRLIDNLLIKG